MTVLEVIQRSATYLGEHGVDSPRLQAELLLAHVLKLPRLRLYLGFDRVLTEAELATTRDLVKRRGQRVPLQHLTGSTAFLSHEICVSPDVLVPRPETETLAQLAIERLRQMTDDKADDNGNPAASGSRPRVLDFGTGSGCLAIALAEAVPSAEVHALDVSALALALARLNATANGVGDRITFHEGDGFAALSADSAFRLPPSAFGLIVTNPPYIPSGEIATLDPEVRDHDPRLALDGGPDGLDFYRRLAAEAPRWLAPAGCLLAEFGDGQAPALTPLFGARGWGVESVEKDLSGRERVLIVRPPLSG